MTDLINDPSHPVGKPFLSKIIEVEKFKRGQANIVIAPCHSGKTTAIGKIISTHATRPEKVLCLIDTTAGKEAMVTREHATAYRRKWLNEIREEVPQTRGEIYHKPVCVGVLRRKLLPSGL